MERIELADLRRDFTSAGLLEGDMAASPFEQFSVWLQAAINGGVIDPNAMTLSTVGEDGRPSARVVLLKGFSSDGFSFYTNYTSKKGRDLDANPYATLHFFWPQLDRQIGIYGKASKTTREESEIYFLSRPVESRISAWASRQSSQVASRDELEQRVVSLKEEFGDNVPLPDFWGGFNLVPDKIEFWQGRQNRLHDRIVYTLADAVWTMTRLAP